MARIILTGVSGFVGRALAKRLIANGHEVVGVSRRPITVPGAYTHLTGSVESVLADPQGLVADALIHLAWTGSGGADRDNLSVQLANVVLSEQAVQLAAAAGAKRFLGIGTVTEGEVTGEPFTEASPPSGAYLYGLAKVTSLHATRYRAAKLGVEHLWARLGNTYGLQDTSGRFLSGTLAKLLADEPVTLTSGEQPYDFLYLEDAAAALEAVLFTGHANEDYYLGSGSPRYLKDYVKSMAEVTESNSDLQFGSVPSPSAQPWDSFSIEKLTTQTSFRPAYSFEDGLALLVDEARRAAQ